MDDRQKEVEVADYYIDGYNAYTDILRHTFVQYLPEKHNIDRETPLVDLNKDYDAVVRVRYRILENAMKQRDKINDHPFFNQQPV